MESATASGQGWQRPTSRSASTDFERIANFNAPIVSRRAANDARASQQPLAASDGWALRRNELGRVECVCSEHERTSPENPLADRIQSLRLAGQELREAVE